MRSALDLFFKLYQDPDLDDDKFTKEVKEFKQRENNQSTQEF